MRLRASPDGVADAGIEARFLRNIKAFISRQFSRKVAFDTFFDTLLPIPEYRQPQAIEVPEDLLR